ncbi:uncharacterized protein LOC135497626 [Lineus longissimus]|uniref:uncharacterized protein LOC135497626 n=1 Tax=Lineus longissimus TaxID=88925 RepID=UPI00315DBB23
MVSLHSEGSSGSSLRTQEHLSVKHALPKTRVTHTILHENVSQDRQLGMVLRTLNNRQKKYEGLAYQTKNTFLHRQKRKEEKWKREDTVRLQSMKFPTIRNVKSEDRPGSMLIMYRKPRYPITESDDINEAKPPDLNEFLLPIMEITPEKTEIVTHREKTFITKLPPVVKVDELKLKRFNTYCGTGFLERSLPGTSERFRRLTGSLSDIPAHFEDQERLPKRYDETIDESVKGNGEDGIVDDGEMDDVSDEGEVKASQNEVVDEVVDDETPRDCDDTPRDVDVTPHDDDGAYDGDDEAPYDPSKVKTPEPSLYRRLKIDRDCMFPMLNKLTKSSSDGALLNTHKVSGEGKASFRRLSQQVVRDIKTKSVKDLSKRYGLLATVNARYRKSSDGMKP